MNFWWYYIVVFLSCGIFFQESASTLSISMQLQVEALEALYNATNGAKWFKNSPQGLESYYFYDPHYHGYYGWSFKKDENGSYMVNPCLAKWEGVKCLETKSSIVELELADSNLVGTIPPKIVHLTDLAYLNLEGNKIRGQIRSFIGDMTKLKELRLSMNSLSGSIPEELWKLTKMWFLSLSDNKLSGTISPLIGGIKFLYMFGVSTNRISGTIPDEVWKLTTLSRLDLSGNALSGTIAPFIGGMVWLTYLGLGNNSISGSLPNELWKLTCIDTIDISQNRISGSISSSIGGMSSLTSLSLDINSLSGTIPNELWGLSNLTLLQLSKNRISGSISSSIGGMSSLVSLRAESNHLFGFLPLELSRLLKLKYLDFSTNALVGSIPSEFSLLTSIIEFQLRGNKLTNSIPAELGALKSLVRIDLSSNQLSGCLPISVGELTKLQVLHLSRNRLSGNVPSELCSLSSPLRIIDLSANSMTGTVPSCLSNLRALESLVLAKNHLTSSSNGDTLSFLLAPNLATIDISSNGFRGILSAELFLSTKLKSFAAVSNCLQGSLPDNICRASSLEVLVLDGLSAGESCRIRFWGARNSTIFQLTGLKNRYKMVGTIPECLFSLPNIRTLHVSGNGLAGKISGQISVWPAALRDLTLSHNQMTGLIPIALQRLVTQFDNFDLSFNKLGGLLEEMAVSNNTKVSLNVNRFSGFLSSAIVKAPAGHINILEGNLIDCDDRKTQLPSSDRYIDRFKCGSDTFNNYLISFAVLLVPTIGLLFRNSRASIRKTVESINPSIPDMDAIIKHVLLSLRIVRLYCTVVAIVIMFVMLPAYLALNSYEGNHRYLYAWAPSAAFKSGIASAIVLLVLWTLFLFGNLWLFLSLQRGHPSRGTKQLHSIDDDDRMHRDSSKVKHKSVVLSILVLRLAVIFAVNAAAMLVPNIGYVIVVSLYSSSAQTAASFLLTVYKLVWNLAIISSILKTKLFYLGVSDDDIDAHGLGAMKGGLVFDLMLSAFNSVIAPSVSLMVADSNCFVSALYAPAAILSSYQTEDCKEVLANIYTPTYKKERATSSFIVVCSSATQFETYQPSFEYNYQCSSTLLQAYSPVFLLMALYSAFGEPLLHLGCQSCMSRFSSSSRLRNFIGGFILRMMQPLQERERDKQMRCEQQRPSFYRMKGFRIVNHQVLFRALMQDIMILLTFGTAAPLLGLAFVVSLMSRSLRWHHLIVGFVGDENEIAGGGVADLTADCRESMVGDGKLYSTGLFIVTFASVFLSFFIVDSAGDVIGWRRAIWAPVLMWVLPVSLGVLYQGATRESPTPVVKHVGPGEGEGEIEIPEMGLDPIPGQNPIHEAATRRSSFRVGNPESSITKDASNSEPNPANNP